MNSPVVRIPTVDPLRFPLQGSHLIEASAGTGKTWTIAALYVRLVLGHGGQPARLPADILVLTFTEAAARELRDRIRDRLAQAAAAFAHADGQGLHADDPFLAQLRADHAPERWPSCARVLDLAAQSMDEAAISTIHGWCRRVLREHAFACGSLFEQQLQPDLSEEMRQVAWDYWRAFVVPLPPQGLEQVLQIWPGPDALMPLVEPLPQDPATAMPDETLSRVWARAAELRAARLCELKAPWLQAAQDLEDWLDSLGRDWKVQSRWWRAWVRALRDWAVDPQSEWPDLKTGWERLVPEGIREKWQGDGPAPEHPASVALARLKVDLEHLPSVRVPVQEHALGWMAARLRRVLAHAAVMGFDGLLGGLDAALAGGQADALARTLRRQFPVVLVDEFQDTDPVQYRIFDRIYRVADNDPDTGLIFIGDPKQSIYGFRGADVHTYLRAVRACADRVRTLDRNFRSSADMVEAVNRCFERPGAQAFPTSLEGEAIAFHPVRARGRDETWEIDGSAAPVLSATWIEPEAPGKPLSAGHYDRQAAGLCARRVAGLLAAGRVGRAGLRTPAGLLGVRPADIAILVNTHAEARVMRAALGGLGVRSVYLSERDSVYEAPQAAELALWLQACLQPEEERAVRAALATPLLGLSAADLARLVEDERAWDAQVERFQAYRQCWRRRGVLPMLRLLLQDFGVPARLLADGTEGERRLTDCLHLAELLQQAAAHLDGEQAVLRHLHQQRRAPAGEDARRLRLESDEDLVRVVTVHKSKGLEYPLVFLPFVCKQRAITDLHGPYWLPRGEGRQRILEADEDQLRQLDQERLGEDVRKLYVALTRARHAVWLALGPLRAASPSGIGHVLGADLQAAWDDLVRAEPGRFAWESQAPEADAATGPVNGSAAVPGPARRLAAPAVGQAWWMASYSALHLAGMPDPRPILPDPTPETAAEDILREGRRTEATETGRSGTEGPDAAAGAGLEDFPRGSEAGTFLHGLLEWAGQRRFRDLDEARDLIARRCAVRGWENRIETLHRWLLRFAGTAWTLGLPGDPVLRLDRLQACRPEMEFWLPADRVDVTRLDRIVTRHSLAAAARPALAPAQLNGMFKGFIDLALQNEGRYYVIDYKSNDLGPRAADYSPDRLAAAMCAHRYDVQMLMYVLALHRQLRARRADYDYARDLGGAVYLFLRGQDAPGQGVLAWRPPRALIEALDALFDGREPDDDEF